MPPLGGTASPTAKEREGRNTIDPLWPWVGGWGRKIFTGAFTASLLLSRSSAAHFSFRRLQVIRVPPLGGTASPTAKEREGRNTIDPSDPAMQHTVKPMAKLLLGILLAATCRPGRACSGKGGPAPRSCHVLRVVGPLQRWTRPPLVGKFP